MQEVDRMRPLFIPSFRGNINQQPTGPISCEFLARTHGCSDEDVDYYDQAIFLFYIQERIGPGPLRGLPIPNS